MRYLRADHSLLGGLWIGASRDQVVAEMEASGISLWAKVDEVEVVRRAESIYSTFILQEVCRLVVRTLPPSSSTLPLDEVKLPLVGKTVEKFEGGKIDFGEDAFSFILKELDTIKRGKWKHRHGVLYQT